MLRIQSLLPVTLPLALCCAATAQQSPDEALRALLDGNRRFAEERSVPQPVGPGIRHTLARGQSPLAVIVTCADSRVPPEHLFNTGLGELIVVRTAGHVLGTEAIATIEDAVERLGVPLCIVLGHEHCDVVSAAIDQSTQPSHQTQLSPAMVHLFERIEPAIRKANALDMAGKQLQDITEEEHTHGTVAECMSRSPLLRRYASVGKFRIVAARYHSGGDVEMLPSRPLPAPQEQKRPVTFGTVPPSLPPHVALRMLRAGHRRFLGDSRPAPDLSKERRKNLEKGQQPLAIVLTDSDSRVSPEHLFDAGIGELFVIRTAGNTLTEETLASIEFAASRLGASLLVVMGHSRCNSVVAAADHPEKKQLTPNQRKLLRRIEPSIAAARADHAGDLIAGATKANVLRTITEARSRSTLLRELENRGQFSILATYYDVAKGDLTWLKMPVAGATAHASGHDGHGKHDHSAKGHDSHVASGHAPDNHGAGGHDSHGHDADGHGAGGHGKETHGHGDHKAPHGETAHGDHAHGAASHGTDSHGADSHGHDSHGDHAHGATSHGADSHGADGHSSGSHGADPHAATDLPPAPGGEMAFYDNHHGGNHDTSHGGAHDGGDAHGGGHGTAAHDSGHGASGHGHGEGDGHSAHGDGHSGHGHPHGSHDGHADEGHGDHDSHGESHFMVKHLQNPVVLIGVGGIASLIAAAWLVLRRK